MPPLKFAAFSSDVELPFYSSLASLKINHDMLDDSARRVLGLYEIRQSEDPATSCRLQIHGSALTSDKSVVLVYVPGRVCSCSSVPNNYYRAEGIIKNLNTVEEYKALDKAAFLNQAGRTVRAFFLSDVPCASLTGLRSGKPSRTDQFTPALPCLHHSV